jgi:hypothetical protein
MQLHPITATLPIDEHQCIFSHFRDEYLKQSYSDMHIFGYMDVDYGRYFQSSKPVLDIYLDFFMKVIEMHLNKGDFNPENGAFDKELAAIAAIENLPAEQVRKLENILVFSAAQSSRFMYEIDMCGPVHVNALAALLTNKSTSDADANRLLSTLLSAGANDSLVSPNASLNVDSVYMSDFVLMAFRDIAKMDSVSASRVSMLVDCVTGGLDQLASGPAERDEVKFKLYVERISSTLSGISFNAQINEGANYSSLVHGESLSAPIKDVLPECLQDIIDASDNERVSNNIASSAYDVFDAINEFDCNGSWVVADRLVRVMFLLGLDGAFSNLVLKDKNYDLISYGGVRNLGVSGVLSEAVEFFYKKHDGTIQEKISVVDDFWRYNGSFSYTEEYREFSDALLRSANLSKDFFIEALTSKVFSVHLNEAIDAKCHLSPLNKDELAELLDKASTMYASLSDGGRGKQVEASELKLFIRALVRRFYSQCYLAPLLTGQPVDHAEFAPLFVDGIRNDVLSPADVTMISRAGMTKLYEAGGKALCDALQANQLIHDIVVSAMLQEKVDTAMMLDRALMPNRPKHQL